MTFSRPDAEIAGFLTRRIAQLSANTTAAQADRARLRRGVGKQPGEIPDLWALTLDGPSEHYQGEQSTRMENAIYITLTLFAVHQQSKATSMHRSSDGDQRYTMGWAGRHLTYATKRESAVRRHMDALTTASTPAELAHHAKSLISQFRSESIPLDYVQFGVDLYRLQDPRTAPRVLLSWGRDFVANSKSVESSTEGA